tara:strand:+ start:19874 stop:20194 length:321 start_codon:yes stop_codon:yes gene_type:complete
MKDQQNHPLYQIDRDRINRLLGQGSPNNSDLVDLARLIIRYQDFPGADDLKSDLLKVLNLWKMTKESLNSKTKEIWEKGFRPGNELNDAVGSGFDTDDMTSNRNDL